MDKDGQRGEQQQRTARQQRVHTVSAASAARTRRVTSLTLCQLHFSTCGLAPSIVVHRRCRDGRQRRRQGECAAAAAAAADGERFAQRSAPPASLHAHRSRDLKSLSHTLSLLACASPSQCPSNLAVNVSDQSCSSGDCDVQVVDHSTLIQRTEAVLGVDWELQKEILRDMHKNEKKYRVYNGEVRHADTDARTAQHSALAHTALLRTQSTAGLVGQVWPASTDSARLYSHSTATSCPCRSIATVVVSPLF
jgi:hypothetical protein